MSTQLMQRPRWEIERMLGDLIGHDVRVAAKAFSPAPRNGAVPLGFIPVRDLYLPDNSQPAGLPVFFEGRLRQFERQIGVVFVQLDAPTSPEKAPEGPLFFRGKTAVILHGPAVVELAFPFHVERLPGDADNYWRDLRLPRAQFELPFSTGGATGERPGREGGERQNAVASRTCAGPIDLLNQEA